MKHIFFLFLLFAIQAGAQTDSLPPIYETTASEPDQWYRIKATFDTHADTAAFKVYVRNKFEVGLIRSDDGSKTFVQVINLNPYTYTPDGEELFELPPMQQQERKRFLGIFKRRK